MLTDAVRIDSLTPPTEPQADGWDAWCAAVALMNAALLEQSGRHDSHLTPEQALAQWRSPYVDVTVLVARQGGVMTAMGVVEHDRGDSIAEVFVAVAPEYRRRGIGSALADEVLASARGYGAAVVQAGTIHTDLSSPPRLASPTGVGDVPAPAPSVRFCDGHGFVLGQVEVLSELALPVPAARLADLERGQRPNADYDLVGWVGATPDHLVEGYANLRTAMSTAAPAGSLTEEEQVWDADRVRERDARNAAVGWTRIITAARHRATAELVGFTDLHFDGRPGKAVGQGYTLVLPEHRGHSLGLRIKIANLRRLSELRPAGDGDPDGARIITGNAGENDAMLSINLALGYRPHRVVGWWERRVD